MNIISKYDDNGKSLQEIIEQFLTLYYDETL